MATTAFFVSGDAMRRKMCMFLDGCGSCDGGVVLLGEVEVKGKDRGEVEREKERDSYLDLQGEKHSRGYDITSQFSHFHNLMEGNGIGLN